MKEITVTTNDLMSVQEAAKALNRHRYQIYRWIEAGKIISIRLGGILFIPVTEIERLQKAKQMTTEAQVQGLGEFMNYGFTLEHPDEHLILLLHEGEQVAKFSKTGATKGSLQHVCAAHLVMKHGWDVLMDQEGGTKMILNGFLFAELFCVHCLEVTWHLHSFSDDWLCLVCRAAGTIYSRGEPN